MEVISTNISVGADSTTTSYIQPLTLADWNQHRVIGTNLDSVDGTIVQFGEINTPTLKTYLSFSNGNYN